MRKAGLLLLLVLSGCMNDQPKVRPLRPLEIATAPYQPMATTALTGSLMYEGNCLLFRDEESGALLMPVWPAGSTFNGSSLTYHLPGKADQFIAVAQQELIYGQPLRWGTFGGDVYQPFEQQCGAYEPFFVTNVRPAD